MRRATAANGGGSSALLKSGGARRGMATEEKVSWEQYKSGKKSFQEWQDANRPILVGGIIAGYVVVYLLVTRGKKKSKSDE
mmetsp:Transcript_34824/g.35491  ORF Transcript_34824/g.35491 Transcript_34824/m.35491 type:complete len:81 (-) Transcript_34824:15-257(-)